MAPLAAAIITALGWAMNFLVAKVLLTLGWDFEQVWQWDHQNNVPTLRQVGEKMVDLLALQLKDNLWI